MSTIYEYKHIQLITETGQDTVSAIKRLNEFGAKGWRIIDVHHPDRRYTNYLLELAIVKHANTGPL